METTEDAILGGRLRLAQPARGYRIAVDPVLLAAAVPARAGERVLDAGTGVGAAALALAARVAEARVDGLEPQPALARLARGNAAANGMADRVAVHEGDILAPPFPPAAFDHVMANPPYLRAGAATPSPNATAAQSTVEGRAGLADWIAAGARLVTAGGTVTLIHRADRLAELLTGFADAGLGGVVTFPLWPGGASPGAPARRVIVRGRLGSRRPPGLLPGLVLHGPDGGFTEAAEAVLRHAAPLALDADGDDDSLAPDE